MNSWFMKYAQQAKQANPAAVAAGLPVIEKDPEKAFMEGMAAINRTKAIENVKKMVGYGLAGGATLGGIAGLGSLISRPSRPVDPMTAGAVAVDMPVPVPLYKRKKEDKKKKPGTRMKSAFDPVGDAINSIGSAFNSASSTLGSSLGSATKDIKDTLQRIGTNASNYATEVKQGIKNQTTGSGLTVDLKQLNLPEEVDPAAEAGKQDNVINRAIRGVGYSTPGSIPWAYPALLAGGSISALGTFALLNKLKKMQKRQEVKDELDYEKKEYQANLKEMQERRMERFKKQSSARIVTSVDILQALDRLKSAIEKKAATHKTVIKEANDQFEYLLRLNKVAASSSVAPLKQKLKNLRFEKSAFLGMDVGDTAGSAAGLYGMYAAALGLPALYFGYKHGKKNSPAEALEEAAKMRQHRRYAEQAPELFLNSKPTPVTIELDSDEYDRYKREEKEKKKLRSQRLA